MCLGLDITTGSGYHYILADLGVAHMKTNEGEGMSEEHMVTAAVYACCGSR